MNDVLVVVTCGQWAAPTRDTIPVCTGVSACRRGMGPSEHYKSASLRQDCLRRSSSLLAPPKAQRMFGARQVCHLGIMQLLKAA